MAIGSGITSRGYHYLLPGEAPDLAGITQQMATDLDTDVGKVAAVYAKVITRSSGSSTIANNTDTTIGGWDLSPYDKGGVTTSAGVFTVPVPGLWTWKMTLSLPATTAAYLYGLRVQVNGVQSNSGAVQANVPANSNTQTVSAGGDLTLAANDTVTLRFQQVSGAAMAVTQVSASLIRVAPLP